MKHRLRNPPCCWGGGGGGGVERGRGKERTLVYNGKMNLKAIELIWHFFQHSISYTCLHLHKIVLTVYY